MQRLPDFLMLDFCEWIKRVILSKAQYRNIDMLVLTIELNSDIKLSIN